MFLTPTYSMPVITAPYTVQHPLGSEIPNESGCGAILQAEQPRHLAPVHKGQLCLRQARPRIGWVQRLPSKGGWLFLADEIRGHEDTAELQQEPAVRPWGLCGPHMDGGPSRWSRGHSLWAGLCGRGAAGEQLVGGASGLCMEA
jgi:hypothetical protein